MNKERYACSGSHGFIGEHLVERLTQENDEQLPPIRIARSGYIPRMVDGVFYLAAYGNLNGQVDSSQTYEVNLNRVVDALRNVPDRENSFFIYVSTSSVDLPHQTFYSASKRAAEEFLDIYSNKFDFPVAIARPYSVTGPREQEMHLIPKLINSCMTGEEMPFVGEPMHDFIDVRDFVDSLLVIRDNIQDLRGKVFSVGSGMMVSNETVKDMVEEVTGKQANLKRVESMRSYDTTDWVADTTEIDALGWEPKYNLIQTITDMVNEYEKV